MTRASVRKQRNQQGSNASILGRGMSLVLVCALIGTSFYAGSFSGRRAALSMGSACDEVSNVGTVGAANDAKYRDMDEHDLIEAMVKDRVEAAQTVAEHLNSRSTPRFPTTMAKFLMGASSTTKIDFLHTFDYGAPSSSMQVSTGDEHVLILYNQKKSLPSTLPLSKVPSSQNNAAPSSSQGIPLFLLTASQATENCDALNVVYQRPPSHLKQCLAIVGNYESYHLQKWLRVSASIEHRNKISLSVPLVPVGRGHNFRGVDQSLVPSARDMEKNRVMLRRYFNLLDSVMERLRPLAQRVASHGRYGTGTIKTVIVMVCNLGQVELLINFVCSCKAQGFDLGNVLVFVTDQETFTIVNGLGLTAFYDHEIFESSPLEEAKSYGDLNFVAMMHAKVISVQLINMLGYDILFQDVDIVWFRHPLDMFHDRTSSDLANFDVIFQDDGARTPRYAPYSANSGFYYVRYNPRTRYLFTALLYSGDVIMTNHSHQQALSALLIEQSSLFGLRVKVLNGEEFPGGYHYHKQHDFMIEIVQKKKIPHMFHMSWTDNKYNKVLFSKQMGCWYVKEQCEGDKAKDVLQITTDTHETTINELERVCCSVEPLISCHYRDKPSVISCKDSPPIDKDGTSFW